MGSELQDRYSPGSRFVIQPAVDHARSIIETATSMRSSRPKVAVGYTLQGHLAEYILVTEEVIELDA